MISNDMDFRLKALISSKNCKKGKFCMVPPVYLTVTKTRFLVQMFPGSEIHGFHVFSCETAGAAEFFSGTGWTQAGPEVERETIGCLKMRGVKSQKDLLDMILCVSLFSCLFSFKLLVTTRDSRLSTDARSTFNCAPLSIDSIATGFP